MYSLARTRPLRPAPRPRDNDGVQFEMSGAPARDRLVLGIFNQTDIGATADMQWSGSAPVTCQWTGEDLGAPRRTLQPDERVFLECRRSSFDSEPLQDPDAVDVFRADGGDAPVLNIPWPKYGPDNMPVPTLVEIQRAMEQELYALRAELQDTKDQLLGGTWEPLGRDIKEVVNDVVKYEYALVRNGGFRTLTASEWNRGWRVMTSPYMTGDSERFTLGGSMWIWDTRDARDDSGLYHLYYFFQNGEAVATDGNGSRSGGSDSGEGIVYRRLR